MKILELHYSTAHAGAERFVVDISNELSTNANVSLCIIENDKNPKSSYYKNEVNNEINYINLGCSRGLSLLALVRIIITINRIKPDIVHAHTDLITLFLPALLFRKIKFYHTLHNLADKCLRKPYLFKIYKWFYGNKVKAITISSLCSKSFKELYDFNDFKMINNGRSETKPSKHLKEVSSEINSLKLHKNDLVFVHVARCSEQKNQTLLINVFNELLNKGKHVILLIIGDGFEEENNISLTQMAKKGIFFLGVKRNVCDYLTNADFFILSSLWEGLPISLLEALSCKIIPISTPAGGVIDVIENGKTGFLSKTFSFNDFLKTVENAISSFPTFNKNQLQLHYKKNYSIENCCKKYLNAFKN